MIALVRIALSRPYTFVVLALLLLIIGPLAALRTPTDIFPEIRIPVIGVVWNYTGLPPDQMSGRIVTPFQRALTTTVNDIEHIVANSYNGIRHRQDLLPAQCRYPHRQRPGDGDLADDDPAIAARCDAAADPELQRFHRSDHSGRAVGRGPDRAESRRHRHQSVAHAAGHRARRGHSLSVRRQAAAGPDRPQSGRAAGPRPVRAGRRQRAGRAEPDHPGRHPEDRPVRIHHPAQQLAARGWRNSAICRSRPSTARWSMSATSRPCATAIRRRPTSFTSTATARS